jgi:hypothetical protein
MMDMEGNDISNNSVKSMPDLYLPEKMQVPRPTSTDLILQDDEKPECLTMAIVKGSMGFGFTIADSAHGQKVSISNLVTKNNPSYRTVHLNLLFRSKKF